MKITNKQKKQLEIYYNVKFAESLTLILTNFKKQNQNNQYDLMEFLENLIKSINDKYGVNKGGK